MAVLVARHLGIHNVSPKLLIVFFPLCGFLASFPVRRAFYEED